MEFTKETLEQFGKDLVATAIESMGADKIDVKHRINPQEDEAAQLTNNPNKRMADFVKGLKKQNKDMIVKAADPNTEGTDADGGYLVPEVTRAEILRLIPTFGQLRNYCQVIPMGKTDTVNIPTKSTGVSVYYPGEATSITSSKPTLSTIQLVAKKAAGIAVMSSELMEDANVDFGAYVNSLFAEAFGTDEDSQGFAGSGSPMTGIFAGANSFGNEVFVTGVNSFTYDDIVDARYGVDEKYLNGASWFLHRGLLASLKKIKDSNGLPVFVPASSGTPAMLMDKPVVLVENAPNASTTAAGTPLIVLGNLRNSIIGDKSGFTIDLSKDATVDSTSLYQTDLVALRIKRRWAFNKGLTSAYSVISIAD